METVLRAYFLLGRSRWQTCVIPTTHVVNSLLAPATGAPCNTHCDRREACFGSRPSGNAASRSRPRSC